MNAKIVVYHSIEDAGSCGHVVKREHDDRISIHLTHPYGEDHRVFAERLVRHTYGAAYIADIAWDECEVSDD